MEKRVVKFTISLYNTQEDLHIRVVTIVHL